MRRRAPSEWTRLVRPLADALQWLIARLHWWVWAMLALYACSNLHMVGSGEVALVLRFGKLVGAGTPQAVHPPGFLLALPRPFDEVVRVPAQGVFAVEVRDLHHASADGIRFSSLAAASLDPEAVGYVLTGDRNILHVSLIARYRIKDPEAFVLRQQDPEEVLRWVVGSALVREVGASAVDDVLAGGRQELIDAAASRTQLRLDRVGTGMELVALEVVDLAPPRQVREEFSAVQTAYIGSQTAVQEAREYRAERLPLAESRANRQLQEARAYAAGLLSNAGAEAAAFQALASEYSKNPRVVRERLYREGIERALKDAGELRFIPPPISGRYKGLRLDLGGGSK
jgi:modulator of FtsH protease HflK